MTKKNIINCLIMATSLATTELSCIDKSCVDKQHNIKGTTEYKKQDVIIDDVEKVKKITITKIDKNISNTSLLADESYQPFILNINGTELPLNKSEISLKLGEKALFELNNGPINAYKFFFCPTSEIRCPLYDNIDAGYTTVKFTPDMQKPIQYRIGFCILEESDCKEMIYRTITIKSQN